MKIDRKLVLHVAALARLHLTDDEVREFTPQLREVLEVFGKISADDAREEPCFQPIWQKNVLRDDVVADSLSQEEALSNSVHVKDGYFKGPRVL